MIKIKLTTSFPEFPIIRQTPDSQGVWDNCKFYINEDIKECDYWVIYNNMLKEETAKCPKNNTIHISSEPSSFKKYPQKFLNQFSTLITSQSDVQHDNIIFSQQAQPWHVGRNQKNHANISFSKDYDELKNIEVVKKEKLVSIILSNKTLTIGHKRRFEFAMKLKERFGDKLDVFGRGINEISDKWNGVAPYKYHIALENSKHNNYWTEKLSDTFLAGTYPIYYGCPNIYDYFPQKSLSVIDIGNFEESVDIINQIISSSTYENSFDEIEKAKQLVLDKYNLFPMISTLINSSSKNRNQKKTRTTLKPEKDFTNSFFVRKMRLVKNKQTKIKKVIRDIFQ